MVQNFLIIELYFLRILKFYLKGSWGVFFNLIFFKPWFLALLKNFPKLHFLSAHRSYLCYETEMVKWQFSDNHQMNFLMNVFEYTLVFFK